MADQTPAAKLRQTLTELHEQLQSAEHLDAETRQQLETEMDEIRRVLDRHEADELVSDDPQGPTSLWEQFNDRTTEFELSHPRLYATFQRVIDGLRELGI